MRRTLAVGLTLLTVTALATPTTAAPGAPGQKAPRQATLTNFAFLPAETYVPGSEPSGAALGTTPINGVTPPFADQPIQGFSGLVRNSDGTFDAISDNGYGTKANSADFLLRIHRIAPDFAKNTVDVLGGITLTDPNGHIPFPLTRQDRVITGADIDVESVTRGADGSYWMGDEFGPYLLHFDRAGRLLAPPAPLPGVRAPENPAGKRINALLEGTVAGDTPGTLRLNEFDIASNSFTGTTWKYQLEDPNFAIGDAIAVDDNRLLIIERDSAQGADAIVKRVYLADKRDRNSDGKLDKTLVADLLNLANPKHVGGQADPFKFPFVTIEDVTILDDRTIAVLNDNNFPSSSGRTPGKPDNNEFITIRLAENLHADPRVLRRR
jgi:hypothetical protein